MPLELCSSREVDDASDIGHRAILVKYSTSRGGYPMSNRITCVNVVLALLLFIAVFGGRSSGAGSYCEDANDDGNRGYPTMDSKCTVVNSDSAGTSVSARFLGPQVPTRSTDPVCSYPATDVKCRRICGDLPPGKTPDGKNVITGVAPPTFGRFDKFEDFTIGDHHRVCFRVKNWANNGGLNGGEYRTFSFRVTYK